MADSIIVRVDPALLQIKAGEQKSAAITVRNRSEEVAQYLAQDRRRAARMGRVRS